MYQSTAIRADSYTKALYQIFGLKLQPFCLFQRYRHQNSLDASERSHSSSTRMVNRSSTPCQKVGIRGNSVTVDDLLSGSVRLGPGLMLQYT